MWRDMLVSKSLFRAPRNGVATVHHAVSWKHETSPQRYWDFETGFSSAADYISIKNQRTSPIKVSSIDLMRAECHDRLSIANGCSRDVVLSHMFLQSKKKRRELSILIDTKLPQRYSNPVSKNERLEFFPKKCSFLHVSSLTSSSMKKREDMQ